jgi:hypothetical protein
MRHVAVLAILVGAVLAMASVSAQAEDALASAKPATLERPAHFKLVDASPSVDALIDRLLDALEKKDVQALHRLHVTESEYRTFFLPGSAKPGEPARIYDEESSKFYWNMLNTNSVYAAKGIVERYGGRKCHVKERTYAKGQQTYAWYEAYKNVELKLEDEEGHQAELSLGSIANVDGQFKFIGLLGH